MSRLPSAIAATLAVGVFALGVARGSTVASGADSSGYISEAAIIAQGRLTQDRSIARDVPWPFPESTLAPLGWRDGVRRGTIAPTYAAGYPLLMAAARVIAGPRAMFWIVPALGALAVWLTFRLGRRIDTPASGVFAAVLLASSPPFVFQLLQPMSDIPATAWWTAAIVLAASRSPLAIAGSGVAAGLAVLTRPNLAPIGAAIAAYLIARLSAGRAEALRHRNRQAASGGNGLRAEALATAGLQPGLPAALLPMLFVIPFAAACLGVGWLHNHLYGSPFTSGYGEPGELYALANYTPNLHRYTRWLFASETRLVLAGLIAPLVLLRRRRSRPAVSLVEGPIESERMRLAVLSVAIIVIVFASYLFYAPFDNWSYLRFLLPAYPALFVLTVTSIRRAADSLGPRGAPAFVAVVCGVMLWAHVQTIRREHVLTVGSHEQRYERIAQYLVVRVPGRAAVVGQQHTGSVSYYTGLLTIRWDWLGERWLDEAIEYLGGRGYRPMILLEEWEEAEFRTRFAGETFGKLDWPPRAEEETRPATRLYEPADRARFLAGERWNVAEIK